MTRSQRSLFGFSQGYFSPCPPDGVLRRRTCGRRRDRSLPTPCSRRPRRRAAEMLRDQRLDWRPRPATHSRTDYHTGSKRAARMRRVIRRRSRGWLQKTEIVGYQWRSR